MLLAHGSIERNMGELLRKSLSRRSPETTAGRVGKLLERDMGMDAVTYEPIGIIRSPLRSLADAPAQPAMAKGMRAKIELREELAAGLKDIAGFSHLFLIYHLHLSKAYSLHVVPRWDTVERGVFSTRSPKRPNPIGLAVVRLVAVDKNVLVIEGADMVDGTLLLDIKPYVPHFDSHDDARIGWLTGVHFPDA